MTTPLPPSPGLVRGRGDHPCIQHSVPVALAWAGDTPPNAGEVVLTQALHPWLENHTLCPTHFPCRRQFTCSCAHSLRKLLVLSCPTFNEVPRPDVMFTPPRLHSVICSCVYSSICSFNRHINCPSVLGKSISQPRISNE